MTFSAAAHRRFQDESGAHSTSTLDAAPSDEPLAAGADSRERGDDESAQFCDGSELCDDSESPSTSELNAIYRIENENDTDMQAGKPEVRSVPIPGPKMFHSLNSVSVDAFEQVPGYAKA